MLGVDHPRLAADRVELPALEGEPWVRFDRDSALDGVLVALLLCREARVPEYRVHDARHAAATILVEMGVHIRTIQAALGHVRVTTIKIYTRVAEEVAEDAADQMGAALFR